MTSSPLQFMAPIVGNPGDHVRPGVPGDPRKGWNDFWVDVTLSPAPSPRWRNHFRWNPVPLGMRLQGSRTIRIRFKTAAELKNLVLSLTKVVDKVNAIMAEENRKKLEVLLANQKNQREIRDFLNQLRNG